MSHNWCVTYRAKKKPDNKCSGGSKEAQEQTACSPNQITTNIARDQSCYSRTLVLYLLYMWTSCRVELASGRVKFLSVLLIICICNFYVQNLKNESIKPYLCQVVWRCTFPKISQLFITRWCGHLHTSLVDGQTSHSNYMYVISSRA